MGEVCGCGGPEIVPVDAHDSRLAGSEGRARHGREHLAGHGVPGRTPDHSSRDVSF